MNKEQMMVRNFMWLFSQEVKETPGIPTATERVLAKNLNCEEFKEMLSGMGYMPDEEEGWYTIKPDLVEFADGAIDLLYVIYWALNSWGIDAEPLFKEVHKCNMNKAWTLSQLKRFNMMDKPEFTVTGSHIKDVYVVRRFDGKVVKPPGFKHPDIGALLEKQMKNKTKQKKKGKKK